MDGTECGVCFHYYDDQKRLPRTLNCGHTLCTHCISEAIKDGVLVCPYCRLSHNVGSAKDISITFALLSLSLNRSTSEDETSSSAIKGPLPKSPVPKNTPPPATETTSSLASFAATEPDLHAGVCIAHRSFKIFWCSDCMVWVCRDCCVVDHPSKTCSIISIEHALRNLKEEENVLYNTNKEAYMKHLEFLREYQSKLEERAQEQETQIELFKALTENHSDAVLNLRKEKDKIKSSLKEAEIAISRMDVAKDHLMRMSTTESIEGARRELKIRTKILSEWISTSKDDILRLGSVQMSDRLSLEIKMMLIAGGYSISNPLEDAGYLVREAKKMFKSRVTAENLRLMARSYDLWSVTMDNGFAAPVVFRSDQLHLSALRPGGPRQGSFILPYLNARGLKPHSTTQVFLEFSFPSATETSTIYIKFRDNENLHASLIRRCTGELPPTFRDTTIHFHTEKRYPQLSQLYAGLLQGNLKLFKKVTGASWTGNPGNGLVTLGHSNGLPCFVIWYKAHIQTYDCADVPIGRVTRGLEVIEAMATCNKASDIRIVESGLIIG